MPSGRRPTAEIATQDRSPRNTANPVLVVGTRYDPATRYEGALDRRPALLPTRACSRVNGWGHTSLFRSRVRGSAASDVPPGCHAPAPRARPARRTSLRSARRSRTRRSPPVARRHGGEGGCDRDRDHSSSGPGSARRRVDAADLELVAQLGRRHLRVACVPRPRRGSASCSRVRTATASSRSRSAPDRVQLLSARPIPRRLKRTAPDGHVIARRDVAMSGQRRRAGLATNPRSGGAHAQVRHDSREREQSPTPPLR